jgi:hypothetical protein
MLSDYDPLIIVNQKIRENDDSSQLQLKLDTKMLNAIFVQTEVESEIRKDYCEICQIRNVKFQGHHVGGWYNDFRQITVCIPCHEILTLWQKIDERVWMEYNHPYLKLAFFYKGLRDVLILMAQKRNNFQCMDIGNSLIDTIYYLERSSYN